MSTTLLNQIYDYMICLDKSNIRQPPPPPPPPIFETLILFYPIYVLVHLRFRRKLIQFLSCPLFTKYFQRTYSYSSHHATPPIVQ